MQPRKGRAYKRKLTDAMVDEARTAYAARTVEDGPTYPTLAARYGVSAALMAQAITGYVCPRGKGWEGCTVPPVPMPEGRRSRQPHHAPQPYVKRGYHTARGEENAGAKLTDARVREMRREVGAGRRTLSHYAALWGINLGVLSRAANGRSWTHVREPAALTPKPCGPKPRG